MSDNENELSENELDSLLADLESRAGSGGGGSGAASADDDDDEDLEAFLASLDAQEDSGGGGSKKVATAERDDDLDARFAELDNLQPDDLPVKAEEKTPAKEKKKSKKDKKKAKKAEKGDAEGDQAPSKGAKAARVAAKWFAMALPVMLLAWVLGAYLAQWISAGWLITLVALTFVLALPALAVHFSKKGKFSWWAAGLGLLFTVGLTAPMPQAAASALSKYGHWPATALSEVAGWEADNALVGASSTVAGWLGGLLETRTIELPEAKELGTDHPIGSSPPAGAEQPASQQSEGQQSEGQQGEPTPEQPGDTPPPSQ